MIQRCLHLVECLTSELRNKLHGSQMAFVLKQQNSLQPIDPLADFAGKLEVNVSDERTSKY